MLSVTARDFLKVPPFPGARQANLCVGECAGPPMDDAGLDQLVARVRRLRVGGTYWGGQPPLPQEPYLLVRIADASERARRVAALGEGRAVVEWTDDADPWHLLSGAAELVVDSDDEAAVLAFVAGVPVTTAGSAVSDPRGRFREIASAEYRDPFTAERIAFAAAAEISGSWRQLIDSNRALAGAIGFAFWKRKTVAPLLWNGRSAVNFEPRASQPGETLAIWKSRTSPARLAELERDRAQLVEVEDGFIRSIGLGADCVPPLSIVVDTTGIYFDPSAPSDLEHLLQDGDFAPELVERARALRRRIVELGISKYAMGGTPLQRRSPDRRHLLVTGQVEDDRAVLAGGGPRTNLELLRRVRSGNPDAYILYKPHPDVEAGHRPGAIAEDLCLELADEVVRDAPIASLIALADEVHVNTSLAGFEALLREKPVTTYGVPFYAGWGIARDLGPVPERRTKRRSLDELVAAALILYPRHLDPATGLPCPPEVLVERLSTSSLRGSEWGVVQLRKLQGQWNRAMAALRA